jgi:hypothetical protein
MDASFKGRIVQELSLWGRTSQGGINIALFIGRRWVIFSWHKLRNQQKYSQIPLVMKMTSDEGGGQVKTCTEDFPAC